MKCISCGTEKNLNERTAWHEVSGYAQHRSQGGTNALALRRRTGRVMCNICMMEAKAKLPPGQEGLF